MKSGSPETRDEFLKIERQISIRKNEVLDANRLVLDNLKFQQENVKLRAEYDKVVSELQQLRGKNKKAEKTIEKVEAENEKLAGFLHHILKTRNPNPENTGEKLDDVQPQQYRRKLESLKCDISASLWFAKSFDLMPTKVTLKSSVTNKDVELDLTGKGKEKIKYEDLDNDDQLKVKQLTLLLDEFPISNSTYHELRLLSDEGLPHSSLIAQCRKDASKFTQIERLPGKEKGAYVSLKGEIARYIQGNPELTLKFKFAGDGAQISRVRNYVIFSMVPITDKCDQSAKSHIALAIVQGKEDYDTLLSCCRPLLEELKDIMSNGITIEGTHYQPHVHLGGDMKFLQTILGINVSSSSAYYSCVLCCVHKDDRADMSFDWDYYSKGKLRRDYKKPFKPGLGHKYQTLIVIDLDDIAPCTLHLLLRVTDVLEMALIQEMKQRDIKARIKKEPQRYLTDLIDLINSIGVSYKVWDTTDKKGTTSEQKTSLTGDAKLKLLHELPDKLMSSDILHEDTKQQVCQLWKDFLKLYIIINRGPLPCPEELFKQCKQWILDYQSVGQKRLGYETVTPYMHILAYHIPYFTSIHGTLAKLSGQGVEKLNDVMKTIHHQKTNKWDGEKQALETRKRMEALQPYKRKKRAYNLTEEGRASIKRSRAAKRLKISQEQEAANVLPTNEVEDNAKKSAKHGKKRSKKACPAKRMKALQMQEAAPPTNEDQSATVNYEDMTPKQLKEKLKSINVDPKRMRSKKKLLALLKQNI